MKYIKTFETAKTKFSLGDIIICVDDEYYEDVLIIGDEYKITRISDFNNNTFRSYNMSSDAEEIFLDVINIKTDKFTENLHIYRFLTEIDYQAKKYNI